VISFARRLTTMCLGHMCPGHAGLQGRDQRLDMGESANRLSIDLAVEAGGWPASYDIEALARAATEAAVRASGASLPPHAEVSLLLTDDEGIRRLNARWRDKDSPTNVLSFPQGGQQGRGPLLGDIVLGFETVRREAELGDKPLHHHIAHLIVHGTLHLLGHDHETDMEAEAMERLEADALRVLGIPDPYAPDPKER
jgi:probable rRNA maturation factor